MCVMSPRRTEEKRRRRKKKQQRGIKTLPSFAPPVERTVIQELAFPATAEDASSPQFHSLTRPMDANKPQKKATTLLVKKYRYKPCVVLLYTFME